MNSIDKYFGHGFETKNGIKRLLCVALLALPLSACSFLDGSDEDDASIEPTVPAEELYNEGLAFVESGEYVSASKKFSELEKSYPYAEAAKSSLIMTAFTYHRAGKFDDSIGSAERYISLFPTGKDVPYALYLLGENNFVQIKDIKRDQTFAEAARQHFDELNRRFPESKYSGAAREKADQAHDQLGGKEMDIGRYYLNQRNFVAAINRFKVVLRDYQTTRHIEEALHRLVESYLSLGVAREAQTAAAVLGYNYPESLWYNDTYSLLREQGLRPKENKGSWISKLVRKQDS